MIHFTSGRVNKVKKPTDHFIYNGCILSQKITYTPVLGVPRNLGMLPTIQDLYKSKVMLIY